MFSVLDKLTKYPSLWLALYACGAVMVIATIAGIAGTVAAGSATGFFVLAGVLGYESLTRRNTEETLSQRVSHLEDEHDKLARDTARTRNDVDLLRDDMAETSQTLDREVNKILNQAEPAARAPASALRIMQKSFERIGNRTRPPAQPSAKSFMPIQKPANNLDIETATESPSRTQKYKDLLLMAAARQHEKHIEKIEPTLNTPEYSDAVIAELVTQAVRNEKIEIFAQPIVKLPSRRLQYLELFARIRARSGVYLSAGNYRSLAERDTMIENVDHLLLLHVLDTIRTDARRKVDIGYFINISSRCLKDKNYMTDLLEFVKLRRDLASRLVFELQYTDIQNLSPACLKLIDGLARIGCKFSVDNIPTADFDVDSLAEKGFTFIKFSADKLIDMCQSSRGEMLVARMKAATDSARIVLIVERLEDEHDLKELLDFEIDYGEGYLFGEPDLEMAYRPKRSA